MKSLKNKMTSRLLVTKEGREEPYECRGRERGITLDDLGYRTGKRTANPQHMGTKKKERGFANAGRLNA